MDKQTKSPIELLTDLLAIMTARAETAERERDEARKAADEWFHNYKIKDEKLKEAEKMLSQTTEQLQSTRETFWETLGNAQAEHVSDLIIQDMEGEADNG